MLCQNEKLCFETNYNLFVNGKYLQALITSIILPKLLHLVLYSKTC